MDFFKSASNQDDIKQGNQNHNNQNYSNQNYNYQNYNQGYNQGYSQNYYWKKWKIGLIFKRFIYFES